MHQRPTAADCSRLRSIAVNRSRLRSIAGHCSRSQSIAGHCSRSQSIAVHCSRSQSIAVHCSRSQSIAGHCSQLQSIAVHCSQLQSIAVHCSSWELYKHSNGFRAKNFYHSLKMWKSQDVEKHSQKSLTRCAQTKRFLLIPHLSFMKKFYGLCRLFECSHNSISSSVSQSLK